MGRFDEGLWFFTRGLGYWLYFCPGRYLTWYSNFISFFLFLFFLFFLWFIFGLFLCLFLYTYRLVHCHMFVRKMNKISLPFLSFSFFSFALLFFSFLSFFFFPALPDSCCSSSEWWAFECSVSSSASTYRDCTQVWMNVFWQHTIKWLHLPLTFILSPPWDPGTFPSSSEIVSPKSSSSPSPSSSLVLVRDILEPNPLVGAMFSWRDKHRWTRTLCMLVKLMCTMWQLLLYRINMCNGHLSTCLSPPYKLHAV